VNKAAMKTLTVWRIVAPQHIETAFSGIGAERYGGRFNSKGHKLVYTAGSLSLALLELLVQVNDRRRLIGYHTLPATFEVSLMALREGTDLPQGWDARPHTRVSQMAGDQWLARQDSLVLRVPSVVIPQEYNFLINPVHPDFGRLQIGAAFPIPLDERLLPAPITP
jgi:RES domain-containing protein